MSNLPLPSVLLANVQSLDNKIDYDHVYPTSGTLTVISYVSQSHGCMNNIQLAGFTLYRQDRTATSGKTRGDGLGIFVNNSWCTKSNCKKSLSFDHLR